MVVEPAIHSRSMLTPDEAYFFQKQQHGKPQPSPRASAYAGSMTAGSARPTRLSANMSAFPMRQPSPAGGAPAAGSSERHLDDAEEADRLRAEVTALKHIMRAYDERPAQRSEMPRPTSCGSASSRVSSGSPRNRLAAAGGGSFGNGDLRHWPPRPSTGGSAAPMQSLGARAGGHGRFALRDSTPRYGQATLADLPSSRQQQWPPSRSEDGFESGSPGSLSSAALARAALDAGVVPAFATDTSDGGGLAFQSNAVRFAVAMAERLEQSESIKGSSPSTDGCYTCLAVLREMVNLVGPLGPVLQNVHDALQLSLLSTHKFADGMFIDDDQSPTARKMADAALEKHAAATRGRVPYFVLVRKLEEAAAALRSERDQALEEVARNKADMSNLEEQLATAKSSLQTKMATIDKLMREHADLEADVQSARASTRKEEEKYEILQKEAANMTRGFINNTQRLETEMEQMRRKQKVLEAGLEDAADAALGLGK